MSVPSQEESNALYFSTHAIQSAMAGRDPAAIGQRTDPTGGAVRRPNLGAADVSSGVRSGMYASQAELAKLVPQNSAEESESRIYWDTDSILRASSAGPAAMPAIDPMPLSAPTAPTYPSNAASAMPQARLGSSSDVMSDSFSKPVSSNVDSQENVVNDSSRVSPASKIVAPKYNHDSLMNIFRDALTKKTMPDRRENFSVSAPSENMINHSIDDGDDMYG